MANRSKRTAKKDRRFFEALETGAPVGEAAKHAGYARRSVYEYKDDDEEFARCWEDAVETAVERLELEADRRAAQGVLEPVFYQGVECGHIRKYSDTLLIFRLKALAPDKYRERSEVIGAGGRPLVPPTINIVRDDSQAD